MKKLILLIFIATIFLFGQTSTVFAVTKTDGDLQVTCNDPLFSSSIIWYPGLTVENSFTIKNIGSSTHLASFKSINTSQTLDFANNLIFRIDQGGTNYFGATNDKTMKNFWDNGETALSDISPGNFATYTISVTMPTTLGNEFQGATAIFDLVVGFVGTESKVTISGDGGTVSGASTSVCNDTAPASAPTLLSATAGVNSVVLNWAKTADPVSYYLVAFGVSPNNNTYGNPNVGDSNTTTYTIGNLSGGTTYCFIVRAGNGCMPGPFSNQICTTPTGGTVTGLPGGFAPGVLGVATVEGKLQESTKYPSLSVPGEVKGEETKTCSCLAWPFLLAQSILLLIYYFLITKNKKAKKIFFTGLFISLFIYLIFILINHCWSKNIFCQYFIVFDGLIFALTSLIKKKLPSKSSQKLS